LNDLTNLKKKTRNITINIALKNKNKNLKIKKLNKSKQNYETHKINNKIRIVL